MPKPKACEDCGRDMELVELDPAKEEDAELLEAWQLERGPVYLCEPCCLVTAAA